jgi:polyisoprenoid-binding protein YceI
VKTWLLMLLCLPLSALAQDWKLDAGKSRINFSIKQMNVASEGGFRRFLAQAAFDPAKPEAGHFRVDVDTASVDTGSTEGDDEVKRPSWFDSKSHPWATFIARSVRRDGEGRFTASGDLSIKGISRPLAAPFTLTRQGNGWLAAGRFPLKRGSYGIGGGDWNDVVADDLEVRFNLLLLP